MRMIDNARAAWRHYSTLALVAAANLQGAWASLPDAVHADLPSWVGKAVAWITFTIAVGGLFGKFVDQTSKDKP